MSPYALTRRQTLSGLAATAMMPVAARAQARRYDLKPREVAGGVWMIEGLREVFAASTNRVAVSGFVKEYPVMMKNNPTWSLSTDRAQVMRQLLEASGTDKERIARVEGHGDRKPATSDPTALRNNRIEMILLRKNR